MRRLSLINMASMLRRVLLVHCRSRHFTATVPCNQCFGDSHCIPIDFFTLALLIYFSSRKLNLLCTTLSMLCFLNAASSQTDEIRCDSHPGACTLSHFSDPAIHDSFLISFIHFLPFNLLFSSFLILPLSTLLVLLHPSRMS